MTPTPAVTKLVRELGLRPHPVENGYFTEVYKNPLTCTVDGKVFNLMDSAVFLYEHGDFSPWHRMLHSDEFWVHQDGGTMIVHLIARQESKWVYKSIELSRAKTAVVPAESWYSLEVKAETEGFVLANCILSPAFDIEDMQLMKREDNILNEISNFPVSFYPTTFLK